MALKRSTRQYAVALCLYNIFMGSIANIPLSMTPEAVLKRHLGL